MEAKEEVLKIENLSICYKTDLETVYAVNDISFPSVQEKHWDLSVRREPERRRLHLESLVFCRSEPAM